MKLIKQTTLVYREGSSDKVYEVDLCEVGPESFVVNFRYGRRGANLKEGAKTVSPVARAEADKLFQELVNSKTKKGYRDVSARVADTPPTPRRVVTAGVDEGARAQKILHRLQDSARGGKGVWPLERAIWRAGELRLRAAAPLLRELIGSGGALRDYCIAWALGRCGDNGDISALGRLYGGSTSADFVRRIAAEALLKLSDDETKAKFQAGLIEKLPRELREPAVKGPSEAFSAALEAYLDGGDHRRYAVLDTIYLIDNGNVRPALLNLLRTAPLRPNYFQRIRHIFKAAEYRLDAEVYGLVAYRFETERAMFTNDYQPLSKEHKWSGVSVPGSYIQHADKEIRKEASPIAYGSRTRTYLRRRSWRTLRRMGELGDTEYVQMAVGVLLPYSDNDAQEPKESSVYLWQTGRTQQVSWDAYAPYWPFNHILYSNSPRYFHKDNTAAWRCRAPYKPGDPEPDVREEAFPELWERMPVGLLHLISESNCAPVQQFAVKALRDCREFCAALDREVVIMILGRPYEATARFGFALAKDRYRPEEPDHALVLAVANSISPEARAEAHRWVDEKREHFLRDSDFVISLVTSPRVDTREFARKLLRSTSIPDAEARSLIVRLIAHLTGLDPSQAEEARDIAETVLKSFGQQLRRLGLDVVLDLLAHPLAEVQELGANILLIHELPSSELPEEIIISLINSPFESLRGIGIKLLGELPDESLLRREKLLVALAVHALPDVRNAIRPVIRRLSLSEIDPAFAARLAARLAETLLRAEEHEGVHRSIVQMLREEVGGDWLQSVDKELVWNLAHAPSAPAQELGGHLLETKALADAGWAESFTTDEITDLAGREILAVRRAARTIFKRVVGRFRHDTNPASHLAEMARAVRLLDVKWDDSRAFFFEAFREHFGAEDFTPGILVSVCDSVREDVQRFGRELITKYFSEESGQEYMLKLSEHPSADLQLFVTNYLERYCAGSPQRLEELSHYFTSVLSRVNKARVAKARVLSFLVEEARRSEESARVVAGILTRQSVTVAVGQKSAAIEAMLAIHREYPGIALPISVRPAEVRRAL